jgi:hypothetical protein
MKLPVDYTAIDGKQRRLVREAYIKEQDGKCMYCDEPLDGNPPEAVTNKKIDLGLFPPNFLTHPIHLQHNHDTGMTEGAVHAYCNAVLWQYHHR